ncbi:hypothetical protein [Gloeobacter violaceus]|nr:hypothetical protein [Gloeobacter violaceus]
MAGGLFGSFGAVRLADWFDPLPLRRLIVRLGAVLSVWFVLRP